MGLGNHIPLSKTANLKAGLDGLWKLGRKSSKMALAWKFLQHMDAKSLGVNKVENKAWHREVNHDGKKGYRRSKEDKRKIKKNGNVIQRNKEYVKRQMQIRSKQAKED